MPDKKSFVLYADYIEHFNLLNDIERGQLIMMILYYVNDKPVDVGMVPDGVRMAYSFIKNDIDRNSSKYNTTCQNRAKAAKKREEERKRHQKAQLSQLSQHTTRKHNYHNCDDNDNDSENENENVNDSESENENDIILYSAHAHTPTPTPPTVEEVKAVCMERGYIIDADTFVTYYQSQNWKKANGQAVTDWLSALSYWNSREKTGKGIKLNTSYDSGVIAEHGKSKYRGLK
jgi:hypothetical protein